MGLISPLEAQLQHFDGKHTGLLLRITETLPPGRHYNRHLISLAERSDAPRQAAATWLLKHFQSREVTFTTAQVTRLIEQLCSSGPWESRLHLVQMLPSLAIPAASTEELFQPLVVTLSERNKFVRAWVYTALHSLASQRPDYAPEVIPLLDQASRDEAASRHRRQMEPLNTDSAPVTKSTMPNQAMPIEYLGDRPEFIPPLARWHYQEWAYLRPGDSVEARVARLEGWCGRGEIPLTLVATSDGELLGSASLVEHDMDNRPELSPWLAGVFVRPERRRQGIGAALVRRIMEEAKALEISKLYLYTVNSTSFYVDLGWSLMEHAVYRGKEVSIMSYSSTTAKP